MRIRKGGLPLGTQSALGLMVQMKPYVFAADDQLTIGTGVVAVVPALVLPNACYYAEFRNVSTGGQVIRIGKNPKFTATVGGLTLNPNDGLTVTDVSQQLNGVASGAGALLDRLVFTR